MTTFQDEDRELFHIKQSKYWQNGQSQKIRDKSISTESALPLQQSGGVQTALDIEHSAGTAVSDYPDALDLKSLSPKQLDSLRCFVGSAANTIFEILGSDKVADHLFSEYDRARGREWGSESQSVSGSGSGSKSAVILESTLSAPPFECESESDELLGALCADLNCTNRQIAIGFGARNSHISWCCHRSRVVIWNLSESTSDSVESSLETLWCCTAVRYHPEKDNVLSFGSFSGSITIFEVDRDGDCSGNHELCRSPIGDCFHNEAITEMEWIRTERASFGLVSIAVDGKLLIWEFERNALRHPVMGYKLISNAVLHDPNRPTIGRRFDTISMTNIAFADRESRCVLIATPNGAILNAVIDPLSSLSSSSSCSVPVNWCSALRAD